MSLSTQPYKGARDFYPIDKRIQKYMFSTIRKVVESYGYEEYDSPALEPTDLYLVKGNEEIITEQTYTFTDRGDRSVTLRTEMTPSVSRMVAAKRQELSYPLRWYSIPLLWRYERPQKGRLREFWQLNIDIFGVDNLNADHEVIQVADSILQAFKAKRDMYEIRVNSRKLVNYMMHEYFGLEDTQVTTLMRLADRLDKIPHDEFVALVDALLSPGQRDAGLLEKIMDSLNARHISDLPSDIQSHDSVQNLKKLIEMLKAGGSTNVAFNMGLMRGFDYYTDIVFEVFDKHPDNNRSMFGGGRYDGLVGQFGVETVPTVGFGMGDVTLQNFLMAHNLLPKLRPETDVAILLAGDIYNAVQPIAEQMRAEGIRVAINSDGGKLDKQIRWADKQGIKYIMVIGEQELQNQRFKLRELQTGHEEEHGLERLISIIAAQHQDSDIGL